VPQSERSNLEYRCRDCPWCHGQGFVTIWHNRYTGQPYVELKRFNNGRIQKFALVAVIPCKCPLGFWIRSEQTQGLATALHPPQLDWIIEGTWGKGNWQLTDPTAPNVDDSEVPEPGRLREMIAAMAKDVAKPAKAVLREPVPPGPTWKTMPPTPNVPAFEPKPFVADGSEPPF
jgi:hypothetical protein